jgi:hypothetical protein
VNNGNKRQSPAHEIRFGRVKVTIWANQSTDGVWYSVVVGRIFKDAKSGSYRTANSLGRDDCLPAAKALEEAWFWVHAQGHQQPTATTADTTPDEEKIPF